MSDADALDMESTDLTDVEIKDAQVIFSAVWKDLEDEFGVEKLRFPKEIILLGGAPGAGKGTNTEFIMKARGFTCPPIVVSALLDSPEAKALEVATAGMIGFCLERQAEFDATADREVFADTAWIPAEMQEVVLVAFGCESLDGGDS